MFGLYTSYIFGAYGFAGLALIYLVGISLYQKRKTQQQLEKLSKEQ